MSNLFVLDRLVESAPYVSTVNESGIVHTSNSGSSSTSGTNVISQPFTSTGFCVEFARTSTGTWYDDDFSDGALILYLVPGDSELDFRTTSWSYQRLYTTPVVLVEFRKGLDKMVRLADSVTYPLLNPMPNNALSGALHQVVMLNYGGVVKVQLLVNGLDIGEVLTTLPWPASNQWRVVSHFHNYSRTATETLAGFAITEARVAKIAGMVYDFLGQPAARRIYLHRRSDWRLMQLGMSDAATGAYELLFFEGEADTEYSRIVLAEDDGVLLNDKIDRLLSGPA